MGSAFSALPPIQARAFVDQKLAAEARTRIGLIRDPDLEARACRARLRLRNAPEAVNSDQPATPRKAASIIVASVTRKTFMIPPCRSTA